MNERSLFPMVAFDLIADIDADGALQDWGHWLGVCRRPFGRQSWGLLLHGQLVAVAVSVSTVDATCGGFKRQEAVELARLCAHPDHRDLTRVALRLWRKIVPAAWATRYWPARALVSYSSSARHAGDSYRFDGWRRVGEVGPSGGGGTWTRPRKPGERKAVWVYELAAAAAALPIASTPEATPNGAGTT